MPNTKIVATLGPASDTPERIRQLLEAGVSVFRLNMSHGTQAQHGARVRIVREAAALARRNVAILLDLQGPKIRFGKFEDGGFEAQTGARFTITTESVMGNAERASCTYGDLARDVKAGDRVLVADGAVVLRVLDTDGVAACCEVVTGGRISDSKGINLPGVQVSTPSLTKKDIADLRWGLEQGVDMVALSFVRKREDVLRLRIHLEDSDSAKNILVVSKIEKPEAWTNLEAILAESDGVMVARGDLGVEMALEKVPPIQKSIIRKAREYGKFVITATQMLETMIDRPYPTRAEVSDIANAIYDGTDAVMLSGETSAGKYPVEAVEVMRRTIIEAETAVRPRNLPLRESPTFAEIIADAANRAAQAAGAKAIVVFTATGSTARLISRYRSAVPLYAFSPNELVVRCLSVIFGAHPIQAPECSSTDEMVRLLDQKLAEHGGLKKGDPVVLVAGQPIGRPGSTNLLKLHRVGELR